MKLPSSPLSPEAITQTLDSYRSNDLQWKTGRTFGYVYDPGRDAASIAKAAYASYLTENGLDPTAFPSLLRLENEIVAMVRAHLRGDENVVGTFTSGGTESIMLAVKSARDRARATHPSRDRFEIVLPVTAHAAFWKACHYLGVHPVVTPVDPTSFRADVAAMASAITEHTVMLVGSAPSYAHGVVDPIREIAALASSRGLLCHVDGCVGGFLLPFWKRLGADVPDFDFGVPGVTSLSVDLHKYAFAPKGASLVFHRDASLRKHQIFACAEWTGYSVVNMAVQSSKSGGPLAGAWATLYRIGDEGYLDISRVMRDATARIIAGIKSIPELRVMGHPDFCMVAFTSDTVNVFHIADEMKERNWYVQAQFKRGPSKENLHLSIGPTNEPWVDAFVKDLRECVAVAKGLPPSEIAATVRSAMSEMDPATITDETIEQMMSLAGAQSDGLPSRLAGINEILNEMPAPLAERAFVSFMNGMFRAAS